MNYEQDYKNFLKDKRVAIVGPAKSVLFEKNGSLIDSFDVVVRVINDYYGLDFSEFSEYIGSRTDVVYSVLDSEIEKLCQWATKSNIKYVSTSYPKEEWFFPRMGGCVEYLKLQQNFKTVVIPPDPYFSVKLATFSRPNSGFCAIIDLLASDLKELFITGIDFYRSSVHGDGKGYMSKYGSHNGLWSNKSGKDFLLENIDFDGPDQHNPDAAFMFFKKEMFLKDSRIKVDNTFLKYLTEDKYESLSNFYKEEVDNA